VNDIMALLAILACAFFAGAAIYINLVEHPARLECGTEIAAKQWAPSYRRATVMQASLAATATLAGAVRWLASRESLWLVGTAAIFAVIPVTLLVIFPTNKRLVERGRDLASEDTKALLVRWGHLHAIRSVLSAVAASLFVWAAIR
jgi:hypothetical protein